MSVLHINSYYSTSLFYKDFFDCQVKNNLNISVYVPVSSKYKNNGFDYGNYTTISQNHKEYDRAIFSLKHYKILKDIQKKYNINEYSLLHAHSLFSNGYIAMKLKEKYGIPYIVAVRNTDVNAFFKKMIHLRNMGVRIMNNASHIVFISKPYRDIVFEKYVPLKYRKEMLRKTSVITNGISEYWFSNKNCYKRKIDKKNLTLLQVGDINKNKNIETTVKAIDLLCKKGYNIKLNVVGKIRDEEIFNRIKDLDYVNYLGFLAKDELIDVYRNSDVFVLPSLHETFGLVYAEAMSQGLPIIYSKGQGFDGQFDQGTVGYHVDAQSPESIEDAVIKIMNNRIDSDTIMCYSHNFSWNKIAKVYTELYIELEER